MVDGLLKSCWWKHGESERRGIKWIGYGDDIIIDLKCRHNKDKIMKSISLFGWRLLITSSPVIVDDTLITPCCSSHHLNRSRSVLETILVQPLCMIGGNVCMAWVNISFNKYPCEVHRQGCNIGAWRCPIFSPHGFIWVSLLSAFVEFWLTKHVPLLTRL